MANNKEKKKEETGRIIAHYGLRVRIDKGSEVVEWKPPRRQSWAVGDVVLFENGKPFGIEPRRNELVRIGSNGARQALAVNLDLLLITTACGEAFKPGLIDRFIVAAAHAGMEPVIILNKIDLPGSEKYIDQMGVYSGLGYSVFYTSAETGDGIDKLADFLKDKISALVGHSGVGKTSLINLLVPGINRDVAQIHNKTERGRHTTSSALMVTLPSGGRVIDSPGIRHFTPSSIKPEDVAAHFPGFAEWMGRCKFRNCLHLSEPGCLILEARDDKVLDNALYESYVRIVKSMEENAPPSY